MFFLISVQMYSDEQFEDRLIAEEIDSLDGVLLNNRVLIEVSCFMYDKVTTKSGLSLFVDNTEQVAQYAIRHGVVAKLPKRLEFFDEGEHGMPWKTTMECEVGDQVWFYAMMGHSCEKFSLKGRLFVLINYADLYVAKRKDQVICLNANVLFKPLYRLHKALSFEERILDPLYAEIAYIGSINTEYEDDTVEDDPTLEVGMEAILHGMPYRYLEKEPYLFFDGNVYIVCQINEVGGYLTEKQ